MDKELYINLPGMDKDEFERQFKNRIEEKMEIYSNNFRLDDLNDANDLTLLHFLIKTELMVEDLHMGIQMLMNDDPVSKAVEIKKLHDLLRDSTKIVTELQKTLAIDRKTRKDTESSGDFASYIRFLKTTASQFIEDRMIKVYCDNCKVMVARVSPVHSHTAYDLRFQCSQCKEMISLKRSERDTLFDLDVEDREWRTHRIEIVQPNSINDNSFEIEDVTSYSLDQYVHISLSQEEMALLYMYENEIRTKVIEGNDVVEGKTFNELKLSFEDDIVEQDESEYGGLEKWYDGKLFAYGTQKIKNMAADGIRSDREVFFINKILYR